MSSHHIVRDEQEPALLILDPHTIRREVLDGLLEWSPTILTNELSAQVLQEWGIKVDYVLATTTKHDWWKGLETLPIPNNESVVDTAVGFLHQRNYRTLNILGNPHHELIFYIATKTGIEIVLYEADTKQIQVLKGDFTKWYPKYFRLTFTPMLPVTYLTTHGFIHNLENEAVTSSIELEVASDGLVKIASNLKAFVISEEI